MQLLLLPRKRLGVQSLSVKRFRFMPSYFPYNVYGLVLRFVVSAGNHLANQSNRKKLYAAQNEQHRHEKQRPVSDHDVFTKNELLEDQEHA
jgi:hypothetical protein